MWQKTENIQSRREPNLYAIPLPSATAGEVLGVRHQPGEADVHLLQRQLLRRVFPGPSREGQAADARCSRRAHVLCVQVPTRERGSRGSESLEHVHHDITSHLLPGPLFFHALNERKVRAAHASQHDKAVVSCWRSAFMSTPCMVLLRCGRAVEDDRQKQNQLLNG